MLHLVKSLGRRARSSARDGFCCALALALCAGAALAEDSARRAEIEAQALAGKLASSPESQARNLAAEIMRQTGDGGLGAWTRSVIEGALKQAGAGARDAAAGSGTSTPPLPAERHARGLGQGRSNTAEVLVFMSLAVPPESWRQWAHEAANFGAPLVLRGVAREGLRATVKAVGGRLGGAEAGVAIDPRLFRLFAVERVPAVVVVPDGVPACASRGCSADAPPPHDLVAGNIGVVAALEAVAAEGDAGRAVARRHLQRPGEPR